MVALEGFTLLPLPQDDELFVGLSPGAKTEWICTRNGCGQCSFDVFVGGWGPARFNRNLLLNQLLLEVDELSAMTHGTLGDRLGGSTGWVRHDLNGFWVRNQKSGYKPRDTVPAIDLGFWRYLTLMMPPTTKRIGWAERCGIRETFCCTPGIFRPLGDERGRGRAGTAISGIYGVAREFQAPM